MERLNRRKTSTYLFCWFYLLFVFDFFSCLNVYDAGGLVVIASTSPTKRLAIDTDISGDAH